MKKLIWSLLSTSLLFFLSSCDGGSDSSFNGSGNDVIALPNDFENVVDTGSGSLPPTSSREIIAAQVEVEIFDRVNDYRIQNGMQALALDNRLSNLLDTHNINMGMAGRNGGAFFGLSHDGFSSRSQAVFSFGYTSAGENVAALVRVQPSLLAQKFVLNWVNSPQHLQNILSNVSATGVAVYVDPVSGIVYASQMFGG